MFQRFVTFPKKVILTERIACRTHGLITFAQHSVSSRSSKNDLLFGRFAGRSFLSGCGPRGPVDSISIEVTTMLQPSRKASIGSTYNFGEDIVTTLALSEVDERSNLECWPHNC